MLPLVLLLALAHDLYLMPRNFRPADGETLTVALHNGDDFPASTAIVRLERLTAPGFRNLRHESNMTLGEVLISSSTSRIIHAKTQPNFIELSGPKFESYLRQEGIQHVLEYRAAHGQQALPGREIYSKYVKSLLSGANPRHRIGYPIEFLPQADPYTLQPGAKLPVLVLVDGKPAPDLQIESSYLLPGQQAVRGIAGRTDSQGRIEIPLPSAGVYKLHTVLMRPHAETADADWESLWASLTFEIQ